MLACRRHGFLYDNKDQLSTMLLAWCITCIITHCQKIDIPQVIFINFGVALTADFALWLSITSSIYLHSCSCIPGTSDKMHGCQWLSSLLDTKTGFSMHGDFHIRNKSVARPSYLSHGDLCTGKTTFNIETPPPPPRYDYGHTNTRTSWSMA